MVSLFLRLLLLLHCEVALQLSPKPMSLWVCRCTTRPILQLPGHHVCKCMLFTSRFISVKNKMLIKAQEGPHHHTRISMVYEILLHLSTSKTSVPSNCHNSQGLPHVPELF